MIERYTANIDSVECALDYLEKAGVIELTRGDRYYKANIILPTGGWIEIDTDLIRVDDFRKKQFSRSVDWGVVIKVLLASISCKGEFTRREIKEITGVGNTTISDAVFILYHDFEGTAYRRMIDKVDDCYINHGINLEVGYFGMKRHETEKNRSFTTNNK